MQTNPHYKIAIIGGGIAGLYAAYRLSTSNIAIFEKNSILGGRIKTGMTHEGVLFELGAARFNEKKHVLLNQLVCQFGLETSPYGYPSLKKSDDLLWMNYPLEKIAYKQFVKSHFGDEKIHQMVNEFGYEILNNEDLPLEEAKRIIDSHPENNDPNSWRYLKDGFEKLIQNLKNEVVKKQSPLFFQHELLSIFFEDDCYKMTFSHKGKIIHCTADFVILAIPKTGLKKIDSNIADFKKIINKITTVSLIKIFLYYEDISWVSKKELFCYLTQQKDHTDHSLRRIYISKEKKEILIYCNGNDARYWNKVFHSSQMKAILKIHEIFSKWFDISLTKIPLPSSFHLGYWKEGVSYWNMNGLEEKKQLCYQDKKIFLVSDIFSKNSGWVEGALSNVETICDILEGT